MAAGEYKPMRVEVSFRIFGEDLDPDSVTEALDITPDSAHRKGERDWLIEGRSRRMSVQARRGGWSIQTKLPPDIDLEEHLRVMLDILQPKAALIRDLRDAGNTVDFFCGLFMENYNEGVELPPETLGRIAALGARLGLDIYDSSEPEDD